MIIIKSTIIITINWDNNNNNLDNNNNNINNNNINNINNNNATPSKKLSEECPLHEPPYRW